LAVPLLCTMMIGWLQWHVVKDMKKSRDVGRAIRNVQLSLGIFRYSLSDAESSQFRYILTHNEVNVGLYQALLKGAKRQFALLRVLTADNDQQQKYLDQIEPLLTTKAELADQSVAMEESGNHAGALEIITSEAGRQRMLAIESTIENMQSVEADILRARQNIYSHNLKIASILSVASMVVTVGCIGGILLLLRRLALVQTEVTLGALTERLKYEDGRLTIEEYLRKRHQALATHGKAQIEAEKLLGKLEQRRPRSATGRVKVPVAGSSPVSQENPPPSP
jgi:CHASE3 domain sensor protein